MNSFSQIIGLWPSAAALAADLGESAITVRSWKQRNSIPSTHWLSLVSAAERRGIEGVSLEALATAAAGGPAPTGRGLSAPAEGRAA